MTGSPLSTADYVPFFPQPAARLVAGASFGELTKTLAALFVDEQDDARSLVPALLRENIASPTGAGFAYRSAPTSEGGKIVFVSDISQIKATRRKLQAGHEAAEAASAAKSRFLANMSHELRTPLNAIIGFSEIISAQLFGALGSPRYVEYATDILRSGRHLLDVINSVLDLSKSEAGKLTLRPEDLDLGEVLRDCGKMVAATMRRGESQPDLSLSSINRFRSGVKRRSCVRHSSICSPMRSSLPNPEVRSRSTSFGVRGDFAVSVSDTGIGMSEQDIQVALTAFGQVDNRLERKYEGAGFGIAARQDLCRAAWGTASDKKRGRRRHYRDGRSKGQRPNGRRNGAGIVATRLRFRM